MWGLFTCRCGTPQDRARHEGIKGAAIGWATISSWADAAESCSLLIEVALHVDAK
jgi:hypothetical protein